MPTSEELKAAGWWPAVNGNRVRPDPDPLRVSIRGKTFEVHVFGPDVYLVDDTGGFILEPSKARRILRKAATGSPIERAFAAAWFVRFGAFPKTEVSIQKHDGSYYRVDFLLPGGTIVELDGHDWHSSKPQRAKDAKRDRDLTGLGYRVIRFTGSEVHADPDACVAEAAGLAGCA